MPRTTFVGLFLVFLGVGGVMGAGIGWAQVERDDGETLARFGEARALAVDPLGRVYVADAGRDVIVVFSADGVRQTVLGGPGSQAGQFDTPSDVDPTNGQTLLVADTYNGRIQRFSADGQFLEAVSIGARDGAGSAERVFEGGHDGPSVQGRGRPIAVATGNGTATFVLDERNASVVKWSNRGQPERIVGEGRLRSPVALAMDGSQRLYVADAGRGAVLAYDGFGTYVKTLSAPPLPDVRALMWDRGRLSIVCPRRVVVWEPSRGVVGEHPVDLPEPLVDIARSGSSMYFLTPSRLIRRSGW